MAMCSGDGRTRKTYRRRSNYGVQAVNQTGLFLTYWSARLLRQLRGNEDVVFRHPVTAKVRPEQRL
jgi:hypothetical protein